MFKMLRCAAIALFAAIVLFPLLYTISASFFTPQDFTGAEAAFLPSSFSLRNYHLALSHSHFGRYVLNSLITASMTAAARSMISILAAFAFTHLRFRGSRVLLIALLTTLFIPSDALLYENYMTIAKLHLTDSYAGIILPSLFSASALLLMAGAYLSADRDIYDASMIDGAGDIRYISSILLPLTAPVSAAVFIQAFISSFNSYLWPLLVTSRPSMRTVQVGITMLGFAEAGETGAQFASIVIVTMPFAAAILLGRKPIMKALAGGIR